MEKFLALSCHDVPTTAAAAAVFASQCVASGSCGIFHFHASVVSFSEHIDWHRFWESLAVVRATFFFSFRRIFSSPSPPKWFFVKECVCLCVSIHLYSVSHTRSNVFRWMRRYARRDCRLPMAFIDSFLPSVTSSQRTNVNTILSCRFNKRSEAYTTIAATFYWAYALRWGQRKSHNVPAVCERVQFSRLLTTCYCVSCTTNESTIENESNNNEKKKNKFVRCHLLAATYNAPYDMWATELRSHTHTIIPLVCSQIYRSIFLFLSLLTLIHHPLFQYENQQIAGKTLKWQNGWKHVNREIAIRPFHSKCAIHSNYHVSSSV